MPSQTILQPVIVLLNTPDGTNKVIFVCMLKS